MEVILILCRLGLWKIVEERSGKWGKDIRSHKGCMPLPHDDVRHSERNGLLHATKCLCYAYTYHV